MNKHTTQRLLEILPGFLTWSTFILPVILSFIAPKIVSLFLLVFAIYWLFKTLILSNNLITGYLSYRRDIKLNWLKKCQEELKDKDWESIYHLVIIATYKEELATVRSSFLALLNSDYPKDKLIVALAIEERDLENGTAVAKAIEKEFGHHFKYFIYTTHPDNIPGETKGKGTNITYCAQEVKRLIVDKYNLPYKDIVVTNLDADHRLDKQYLACITYNYLTVEDPEHKSFQPIPLFFNNIWQTSFPMRLIAMGSTFWQMVEATRPYRLRNFAAHAQSFTGLVETDFWSKTTIVEDGHQYWRSYFKFDGNYQVVPIFIPVYQDAILAGDTKQTLKEQYLQKRRWAYGCSDIPFAIQEAIKNKKIPFMDKWLQVGRLIEGHYSWATSSIVLAVVGWLPIFLNHDYSSTVLAYNFPYFYRFILYSAMIGMIVTLTISTLLLPKPHKNKNRSRFKIFLEWILTPIITPFSSIIFGSFPAIESQTRLMLGKYLGVFRVTIKKPVIEQEVN